MSHAKRASMGATSWRMEMGQPLRFNMHPHLWSGSSRFFLLCLLVCLSPLAGEETDAVCTGSDASLCKSRGSSELSHSFAEEVDFPDKEAATRLLQLQNSASLLQQLRSGVSGMAATRDSPPRAVGRVAWLPDPHVDPYYGTDMRGTSGTCTKQEPALQAMNPFGYMGCDAPSALFESAVDAAAGLGEMDFVLFTGDFVRHAQNILENPWQNVTSIVNNASKVLVSAFPTLSARQFAVGSLGNDDSPMNYEENITTEANSNSWLANMAHVFIDAGAMPADAAYNYSYGGYWERRLGSITVLSINTIIYSVSHTPATTPLPHDPFHQFDWLRKQLHAAKREGRSVWIVGHIPPGIETYGYTQLWHPAYVTAYLGIVQDKELASTIAAQLFAHVHKDEIRLLPDAPEGAGPIYLAGAISPVYKNQPSFRVLEYDTATGRPLNWQTYYAELPKGSTAPVWKLGYTGAGAYPPVKAALERERPVEQATLLQLADMLTEGGAAWNTYSEWYTATVPNDLQHCGRDPQIPGLNASMREKCRRKYRCALTVSTDARFKACAGILPADDVEIVRSEMPAAPPQPFDGDFEAARKATWEHLGVPREELWPGGGFGG
eukprot:TRINITY_DN12399_c1_g1_i1.p1 TRINITY_DN12399_c1_g1~~TRINITY_DN12399_c1_g1_i1.p1  ORF type:complete len:607 (+),score=96.14 TRINITY_DN12399_c1_g1_i1:37-1857(+)